MITQLKIMSGYMSSSAKPIQVNNNPTAVWKYCLYRIYGSTLVYPRSSLFFHLLSLAVHYLVPKKLELSYRAIKSVFSWNSPPANAYNIEIPAESILLCHYESWLHYSVMRTGGGNVFLRAQLQLKF